MDVSLNRDIDKVIILGSGMSILDLTGEEVRFINRCKSVIAVNKFMAFYERTGIVPTHVYFVDTSYSSYFFLNHIFDLCCRNNLSNVTFILSKRMQRRTYKKTLKKLYLKLVVAVYDFLRFIKRREIDILKELFEDRKLLFLRDNFKYLYIKHEDWLKGGEWAYSLHTKLFHYRGSLTTVLNLCAIMFPGNDIFLVGNDFNGTSYFYEDDLDKLDFKWKDWTYDKIKSEGKHFSFIDYKGTKMTDAFPYIIDCLEKTKNKLYCTNSNSLLVKEGFVDYSSLI